MANKEKQKTPWRSTRPPEPINKHELALDCQGGYYKKTEVAEMYGVSKQRVDQILNEQVPERWVKRTPEGRSYVKIVTAKKWTGIK